MPQAARSSQSGQSAAITLLPIMVAVLAGFLIIGLALPVLPLHVKNDLGFGTFVVGLVAGAQFAASLVSRVWAGSFSDKHGAKQGVIVGLIAAVMSGLLYLLSLAFINAPVLSVAFLLVGRAILGGAESFIITAGVSWGLGLVDREHAGKVIAWVGTAMFAAMALGGPFGTTMFNSYGFASIAVATVAFPFLVLIAILRMPAVAPLPPRAHSALKSVLGSVWLPGLGAATASIGYCAILAFSSLFYSQQNWHPIWLAFTAFGVALIVARLIAGHLPDKFGGARVALIFVLVQTGGLLLIWLSRNVMFASVGAAVAGFGYSLVYPGLGVEAVRGTAPENRGLAMGIYTAFLDVAMAVGSPVLGWIADHVGLGAVFLASAIVVFCTAGIAVRLMQRSVPA
ncbi:MFS family permease [Rhizobium petrolearium]|uniref:arabinose transporter n=1 Tax=Neorhizobium petrolearium TaxID=515361 RepID=UPI001AE66A52|nr:arabinose transporter [Neorhizobium petrolearium]MBP1847887.1 MFS family permease [Neorhizobium petrolearium]